MNAEQINQKSSNDLVAISVFRMWKNRGWFDLISSDEMEGEVVVVYWF